MKYCFGCMNVVPKKEGRCPHCGYPDTATDQPPYALPPGTELHNGKYLVGRVLGQGGFGITYVGLDLALELKAVSDH